LAALTPAAIRPNAKRREFTRKSSSPPRFDGKPKTTAIAAFLGENDHPAANCCGKATIQLGNGISQRKADDPTKAATCV
jgi:hypothetical protein